MTDFFSGLGNLFTNLFGGVAGTPQAAPQTTQPDPLGVLFGVRPDLGQKYGAGATAPVQRELAPWEVRHDALQAAVMAPFDGATAHARRQKAANTVAVSAPAPALDVPEPQFVREGVEAPAPAVPTEGGDARPVPLGDPLPDVPPPPLQEYRAAAEHRPPEPGPYARRLSLTEEVRLASGPKMVPPSKLGGPPEDYTRTLEQRPGDTKGLNVRTLEQRPGDTSAAQAAVQKLPHIIDTHTPSPSERRRVFKQGGVIVNLDTNWAKGDKPTRPMVVIPDGATKAQRAAAEAYASRIASFYKEQFGTTLEPYVKTRSQNKRGRSFTIHTEPYAVTDSKAAAFFNTPEGARAHAAILKETLGTIPGVRFSLPHDPFKSRRPDNGAVANGVNEVGLARLVLDAMRK